MDRNMEVHDLAASLDVEMYPGTEIMTDYLGSHLAHNHNEKRATVLVPQPSHQLDDPLVSFLSLLRTLWARLTFG
jgi:hypothetical protein